jgi:uncharacterized short protein YbdD (DUF466 family)
MTDIDKTIEEAWPNSALAAMLPFESWERIKGETALAYSAFCTFRDCGSERTIRKAVEGSLQRSGEKDVNEQGKRYRVWRNWSTLFRWRERANDYDRYMEKLKQNEIRKTIKAQGEMHRQVTGKMLGVVIKKLDMMNPDDLSNGNLTEWVQTAIKADHEATGLVAPNGKPETKQGELAFVSDFQGL